MDEVVLKNITEVYDSFNTMVENLYHIKSRAEEDKDQNLVNCSDNMMTSSFQQMKTYLTSLKSSQTLKTIPENPKSPNKTSPNGLRNHSESSPKLQKENSDDETVFYDALDALILDELEQEVKRESKISVMLNLNEPKEKEEEKVRTTLPALKGDVKMSLLKVLKDAVGKDLTKFSVPVYFNEPISMLQKTAELMEFDGLLKKASETQDPMLRLSYVAAINLSQYHRTMNRVTKPFNPVLGETFEYIGNGWRLLAEQVSHHPPISALVVQSDNYELRMNTYMTQHFWGKSLEFKLVGKAHIVFHDTGDHFIIQRPNSS